MPIFFEPSAEAVGMTAASHNGFQKLPQRFPFEHNCLPMILIKVGPPTGFPSGDHPFKLERRKEDGCGPCARTARAHRKLRPVSCFIILHVRVQGLDLKCITIVCLQPYLKGPPTNLRFVKGLD